MMDKNKIKRYKLLGEKIKKLDAEREAVRKELVDECEHPKEFVHPYKWHHGYGKYVEGLECRLCRARKSFTSQSYWTKYEDYINADRGYSWEDQ